MRGGIALIVPAEISAAEVVAQLEDRITSAPGLFDCDKVLVDFCGRPEFESLMAALEERLRAAGTGELVLTSDILAPKLETRPSSAHPEHHYSAPGTNARLVKGTIRSGQKFSHAGDVVIMGDVNPGAEVIAKGNIVIFGSLRGVVHAGANGDTNAFVAALSLEPTQVRLAGLVARSPDNEQSNKKRGPEVVFVRNNELVIEPYAASLKCLQ
jgi:septum site-determining protein MinC